MIPMPNPCTDPSDTAIAALILQAETLTASAGWEIDGASSLLLMAAVHAAMKHDAYVDLLLSINEVQPSIALLASMEGA